MFRHNAEIYLCTMFACWSAGQPGALLLPTGALVSRQEPHMTTLPRTATIAACIAGMTIGSGLMLGTAGANAATVSFASSARTSASSSSQDASWAQATAQTDLAEITIGQIAEQRARSSSTKMMAQVTISDHTKALASLKSVAAQVGITLPTAPSATQQAQAAQLKSVASGTFDVTYDSIQIKGHELSISQTKTETATGSSAAVKDNAS